MKTTPDSFPATMCAWRLDGLGGRFALTRQPVPRPRPGGVLVRMQASALIKRSALCRAAGPRAEALVTQGDAVVDAVTDAARVRERLGGGADLAFDMVGGATDPAMTLTALRSLADQLATGTIRPRVFPLDQAESAMQAAREAGSLECVVLRHAAD